VSFARKGSYRKVYTFRGPGTDFEDHIPMTVEEPTKDTEMPVGPQKMCKHGGLYRGDIPLCGECFRQPNNGLTPDQEFAAFLSSLSDVCKRVIFGKQCHRDFRNMSFEEKWRYAFTVITLPKNLLKLLDKKTKNPLGLAYSMAHRRLLDYYRSAEFKRIMERNSREITVSQMNLPRCDWDEELQKSSLSNKLDWLSGQAAALSVERDTPEEYFSRDDYEVEGTDQRSRVYKKIETQLALAGALEESNNVRIFPGVKLLWNKENITRLMHITEDALAKLPKTPYDHSVMIKLRSNAYGGKLDRKQGWDWPALSKWASDRQGKNVTEKQVRYAFERGTLEVRTAIFQHLTPDLGQMIKEAPTRGLIRPKKPAAA